MLSGTFKKSNICLGACSPLEFTQWKFRNARLFNLSAFNKCPADRAGHFRRDVVLNPNKSNLTVATPRRYERQKERARRKGEEIDRAIVTGDRNRRREWGERADERRRGSEVGKENNKASQCQVLGIRRRHPKAVRVIRDRERRDK